MKKKGIELTECDVKALEAILRRYAERMEVELPERMELFYAEKLGMIRKDTLYCVFFGTSEYGSVKVDVKFKFDLDDIDKDPRIVLLKVGDKYIWTASK